MSTKTKNRVIIHPNMNIIQNYFFYKYLSVNLFINIHKKKIINNNKISSIEVNKYVYNKYNKYSFSLYINNY